MCCRFSELSNGVVLFDDSGSPVTESRVSFSHYYTFWYNNTFEFFLFSSIHILENPLYIHFITNHFGDSGRTLGQVCVCVCVRTTAKSF